MDIYIATQNEPSIIQIDFLSTQLTLWLQYYHGKVDDLESQENSLKHRQTTITVKAKHCLYDYNN